MSSDTPVTPEQVRHILGKHILADGYEIVLDLDQSQGLYLIDATTGEAYLDFFSFFASNPLGMNHPRLANDQFIQKLGKVAVNKPSNSDIYTEAMAEFVNHFDRIGIPDYLPHTFFISGGALAVENALKVAFDWKVRKNFARGYTTEKGHKVLHLEQAFHGRTGYTMSLTNTDPTKTRYFPKFDWPRIVAPAMTYPSTEERISRVMDLEQQAIEQAQRYFEKYPDEIAAIILEPIQGEGGDNHFRPEFHRALRRLADEQEALLIYDEVQTGVGMTGKFWAHEHFVKPDILAFGKKAQVCGILASRRVDEVEENVFNVSSRINSTWGGNLVDMVRFGRILQVIEEENLVEHAAERGRYLQQKIDELAERYEQVTNPRGRGLFCAIDFPNTEFRDQVTSQCFKNKLMILGCGTRTVRFRPPLTVQTEHIDEAISIIAKSLEEVMATSSAKAGNRF
ncbi:L-lysine 6-transaminase [Halalkalibaculum sp. DA3122]|uniref:L-lysine 6-transaminase n=1 Tax=unclassified Halalkalibaculum TaxID=2964617 RepID=UPI00375478E8